MKRCRMSSFIHIDVDIIKTNCTNKFYSIAQLFDKKFESWCINDKLFYNVINHNISITICFLILIIQLIYYINKWYGL